MRMRKNHGVGFFRDVDTLLREYCFARYILIDILSHLGMKTNKKQQSLKSQIHTKSAADTDYAIDADFHRKCLC